MRASRMDLMPSIPKKTLELIQEDDSFFVAKVKQNQQGLLHTVQEVEASSEINHHHSSSIKQSSEVIKREVYVYNPFAFPWNGIGIHSVIRIDKSVNGGPWHTHYYISNDRGDGEYFLKKILQEWTVETMHFYKDCSLGEDACKINQGAFALSILRSIVINVLHLNKIQNIGRQIVANRYSLQEALTLLTMVRLEYGFL